MKKYIFSLASVAILYVLGESGVRAQNTAYTPLLEQANPLIHSVQLKNSSPTNMDNLLKNAVEDVSLRTPYSSTWKTSSGKIIAHYSSTIINYTDTNGNLQPIDLSLKSDARGWVADKQTYPCYFHSDRSTAINLGGNDELVFNKNGTVNGMPLDQQITSLQNSHVVLDLTQGIQKQINFVSNGIETNYLFAQPLENGITITEEIEFPDGCIFQKDTNNGKITPNGGWIGDYVLLSPNGKNELARLHAAECYDSKKQWCYANYTLQKKDGKNILVTTVPSEWLAKAVYPITLDPLVTGPTTYWTGGSTPSCLYPNFYTDSILVTIPAGININFFAIDYAYVTSSALNVPLSDGLFYFSTSCGQTDTTGCNTGTPGICYVHPGDDFSSTLTNCFTPSCSAQSFWLDAHLSRLNGGVGCDTSWVWYSKGSFVGSQYYFSAYVAGDPIINIANSVTAQLGPCNGGVKVTASGGITPYTYLWAPGNQTTDSIGGLCSGNYCCTVTDNGGCSDSVCVFVPNEIAGINTLNNASAIHIYPNPNNGIFYITGAAPGQVIEVYNYLGQELNRLTAGNSKVEINISDKANGIYLIRISNKDGTLAKDQRIIKTQ